MKTFNFIKKGYKVMLKLCINASSYIGDPLFYSFYQLLSIYIHYLALKKIYIYCNNSALLCKIIIISTMINLVASGKAIMFYQSYK